jgi:hypothetical protein
MLGRRELRGAGIGEHQKWTQLLAVAMALV